MNRSDFENNIETILKQKSQSFPVTFIIENGSISFKIIADEEIKKSVQLSQSNIIKYFDDSKSKFFYLGEIPDIVIMRIGNLFYANHMKKELIDAFQNLKNNADALYQLRILKRYILPVSILSIFILTVPILVGVFFMSFFVARNITNPIEEIAKGTKIIAGGNLDYKVHVHTHDEIGDLAYNFNSMATKLKTAYRQIKGMERLEAWQEMARRLAHEIKNPLTPIKLSAERLQYAYESKHDEFQRILNKTTATIINESKRLEKLVNEFSQFARLPNPKLEKRDIVVILKELADFFQNAYPAFKINLNLSHEEYFLNIDEGQIKQVIINLVNNAVEASSESEKEIILSGYFAENNYIISVLDKGKGVPKEIQDKIFEPYFTTKEHGSGLGLAIAERIILEHNGNLWFETGENGTKFYIQLPNISS